MNQGASGLSGFLLFQGAAVCVTAIAVTAVWSVSAGMSALFSGLSVWLGNLIYAAILGAPNNRSPVARVFVGQFVKVLVTLGLLGLVVWLYASLVWAGFLGGLFVSLLVILAAPVWVVKTQKKYDAQRIDKLLEAVSKEQRH